jgi:hypothetical protein
MADEYEGKHEAEEVPAPVKAANIAADEASGTPPAIPASARTAVYIGAVVLNALAFLILGLLPALGVMDRAVAAEIGLTVITFIDMLCFGLAVGYRPTRPGSPIG